MDNGGMVLEEVDESKEAAVETREVTIDLILAAPRPARTKQLLPHLGMCWTFWFPII